MVIKLDYLKKRKVEKPHENDKIQTPLQLTNLQFSIDIHEKTNKDILTCKRIEVDYLKTTCTTTTSNRGTTKIFLSKHRKQINLLCLPLARYWQGKYLFSLVVAWDGSYSEKRI